MINTVVHYRGLTRKLTELCYLVREWGGDVRKENIWKGILLCLWLEQIAIFVTIVASHYWFISVKCLIEWSVLFTSWEGDTFFLSFFYFFFINSFTYFSCAGILIHQEYLNASSPNWLSDENTTLTQIHHRYWGE